MRRHSKSSKIEEYYKDTFPSLLRRLYLEDKLSSIEIAEKLTWESGVLITPRYIQLVLKKLGLVRSLSAAFRNAIAKGRKSYDKLRKPIKSAALRKGVNLATRYRIFKRGGNKCTLCGKGAPETILVIDHIKPVVRGGDNTESNLRTLCRECNHGKMIAECER